MCTKRSRAAAMISKYYGRRIETFQNRVKCFCSEDCLGSQNQRHRIRNHCWKSLQQEPSIIILPTKRFQCLYTKEKLACHSQKHWWGKEASSPVAQGPLSESQGMLLGQIRWQKGCSFKFFLTWNSFEKGFIVCYMWICFGVGFDISPGCLHQAREIAGGRQNSTYGDPEKFVAGGHHRICWSCIRLAW